MRILVLGLLFLSLGACAATPEVPSGAVASPVGPAASPPRSEASVEVSFDEEGLRVRLRDDGRMRVEKGDSVEEWRLPVEATEPVLSAFRASGLFGRAARPSESGGPLALGLREGDLHQVRAPRTPTPELRALAQLLKDRVPGREGVGPDGVWIAGTLIHEDLEGGVWKVQAGPQQHFVLAQAPPGFQSGERVRATGRPAAGDTMGIHMAGPYYEVLTLRRSPAAPEAVASPLRPGPTAP